MPSLRELADEQYRQKLAREMSHMPQERFNNPVGDAISQWGRGVQERVSHPLQTLADESVRWQQMSPEDMIGQVGMAGMMKVNPQQIAGLMSDAEKAMLQYELSKIPKKPAVNLRDLAIGGGALGGGGLMGYYGAGLLGGDK